MFVELLDIHPAISNSEKMPPFFLQNNLDTCLKFIQDFIEKSGL